MARVFWCLAAVAAGVQLNEDAPLEPRQHLAQVQAKAELAQLKEQVAIAGEEELEVREKLAESQEHVAALREKLQDLSTGASSPLSFLQTNSDSQLRTIQKKLTEEEDRVEVTRLLLRQKQRKLAKEKEKLELLQKLHQKMQVTAREREKEARRSQQVAAGRAIEGAKVAKAQTEELTQLLADQGTWGGEDQEVALERKFRAQQAALDKQFEEEEAATEEREKKKAFYALDLWLGKEDNFESLSSKCGGPWKYDSESTSPLRARQCALPRQDVEAEISKLQEDLARENDSKKKRLTEHQYEAAQCHFPYGLDDQAHYVHLSYFICTRCNQMHICMAVVGFVPISHEVWH
eukprot:Skav233129  [mRNA]  locus=scaffold792:138991:146197:+ [translate_table: standard]